LAKKFIESQAEMAQKTATEATEQAKEAQKSSMSNGTRRNGATKEAQNSNMSMHIDAMGQDQKAQQTIVCRLLQDAMHMAMQPKPALTFVHITSARTLPVTIQDIDLPSAK